MKLVARALSIAVLLSSAAHPSAFAQARVVTAGQDGVPAPKRVRTVNPVYPQEAMAQGIRGIVILEILIDPQGKVASAEIIRSIPGLDEAALEAVRKWEYEVTKIGGQPVSVKLTVPITFAMKVPEVTRAPGIPELRQGASIQYPAGQTESESVTAEVTLGPDGQVAEAEVTKGNPPFSAAVLAALRSWRFAAEGEGVVLSFRVEAEFTPPRGDRGRVEVRLNGLRRSEAPVASTPPATSAPPPTAAPTATPETSEPARPAPAPEVATPPATTPAAPAPPATVPAAPAAPTAPTRPEPSAVVPAPSAAPPPREAPAPEAPAPGPPEQVPVPVPFERPPAPPAAAPTPSTPPAAVTPPTTTPPAATSTPPPSAPPVTAAPAAAPPSTPAAAPPVEVITAPRPPDAPAKPVEPGVSAIKDVSLALGVPDLVRGRRPVPPPLARMAGTTGSVEVKFGVDAAGATSISEASGPQVLSAAAAYIVQSWFFRRVTAERLHLVAVFDFAAETAKATVKPE